MSLILIPYTYLLPIISGNPNWNDIGITSLAYLLGEQRAVIATTPDIVYRSGCGTLWFVFALVVIKLLFNPNRKKLLLCSLPLSLTLAYFIPKIKPVGDYAIFTVPLAWFFFTTGYFIMHSEYFGNFHSSLLDYLKSKKVHSIVVILAIVVLSVALYFVSESNGMVKFFKSEYGNNLVLMIVGSFFGIGVIYLISSLLEVMDLKGKLLTMVSNGTIIILAFHTQTIYILYRTFLHGRNDMVTFLLSILIMICFIPVIWFIFKYVPIMVGKRK